MTYQVGGYHSIFFAVINSSLSWKFLSSSIISLWAGSDISWLVTKAHISLAFNGNIRASHFLGVWLSFPVIVDGGVQKMACASLDEREWQETVLPQVTVGQKISGKALLCLTPSEWVPLLPSHYLVVGQFCWGGRDCCAQNKKGSQQGSRYGPHGCW